MPPTTEASRLRLNLKGLPAGAYFVTVVTPQGSHTEKLVISD
ncbi:MAG: T9SS type A sorting domain-containing protein [Bacteroidales bacterium]|nr:T9SS type A sorting domain-containing protein [Bacteroidales bacterium]